MFVKPSHQKLVTHFSMAMLASVSMTACQSTTNSSWWRSITAEREPQVVQGPRRMPILNPKAVPAQPQSAPSNAYYPSGTPQEYYVPDEAASMQAPDQSAATPYDQVHAPLKDGENQQPYLLDKINDWFSASLHSDTPAITPDHRILTLASNESNSVVSTHGPVPPANRRKPIIGNLSAMRNSDSSAQHIQIANVDPSQRKAIGSKKMVDKPAPVKSNSVQNTPTEVTEVAEQEVVLPWGQDAPLDQPTPMTPSNPSELSALMPASGMRKEHAEMMIDEVSDEEFIALANEGKSTNQVMTQAPSDDVVVDLEQIERSLTQAEPTPAPMPMPNRQARTNLIPYAPEDAPQAEPELTELRPVEAMKDPNAEEEIELATSDSLTLAENQPEYPPLDSVPPVPARMQEIKKEHLQIKWQLEQEKTEADLAREAVEQQLKEEADESLIQNLRSEPVSALPRPHQVAMLPLPEAQFDDPRWSGPRIAFFAPLPAAFPPMHANAAQPELVVARNDQAAFESTEQQAIQPDAVQLVDQQLEAASKQINTVAAADAVVTNAVAGSSAPPPRSAPSTPMAAVTPKQPALTSATKRATQKAQKLANAVKHAFRKSDFKREVVGVFSVLPYYVYAPVLNENRDVVYLADSRYSNFR